ncbi:LysR family transcriptional regulator [Vibrio tubiashii]|uniref:LysR family transcriptional regulator n=2 Tax=Vibrio tubiashii ATCC 19109 TaxID=1051646 RepID=A0A0A0SLM3_9VIBR|nr:LysR substrate-binding domain-containing protein [Vibrio tubiashii]AIW15832.1 LysR family transcriptional regulator [Vibrio tubiashii ATCC 19109]EIF05164.1 LysR family transcriptional regulator [Vibrio tubiashii NCIMB 1337 = ATCC 19106]
MESHSLDDLYLFVSIARYRSLTQASEHLNIPLATLSRKLKKLETSLGCRLLNRSAHHFVLTPDGERYRQQCEPLLQGLENVTTRIATERQSLSGTLKISAPINMTQMWLKKCVYEFSEKHPNICIDLDVQNEKVNLVSNRIDVTFRLGDLIEQDWIARKLWSIPFGLCASRSYLEQYEPITHPKQLVNHRLITLNNDRTWTLINQLTNETYCEQPKCHFASNDVLLVRDAVIQGLGIAWIPTYYFHDLNQEHFNLQPLLPDWLAPGKEVYMMYRDRGNRPARVDAFIEHVIDWKNRFKMFI